MTKEMIQRESERRTLAERALSTVLAGLLAMSFCGTAMVAFAPEAMGSPYEGSQTEKDAADVSVAFATGDASVDVDGATVAGQQVVAVSVSNDLVFAVDPQEGFTVEEVSLQRLNEGVLDVLAPIETPEGVRYAVTADKLADGAAIVVDTAAIETEDDRVDDATCPLCKNQLVFDLIDDHTSLTITGRTPSVDVKDVEKVYDGRPVSVEVGSVADGSTISYYADGMSGWSTENPRFTDAGTYTVLVRVTRSNDGETEVMAGHVTVKPAPAVIEVRDAEKTVGSADPAFEGSIKGLVDGDEIGSVVYYRLNGGVEDAGSYADVLTALVQHRNGNYAYTVVPGSFTIKNSVATSAQASTNEPTVPGESMESARPAEIAPNLATEFAQGEGMQRFAEDVVVPIAALLGVATPEPITIADDVTPLSAFEEEEQGSSGWTYLWILLGAVILAAGCAVAVLWRLRPVWFMELIYGVTRAYDPDLDASDALPALDARHTR